MMTYELFLESGPRRRKTMVHVLDLLGCVAVGPTTEEALAATPEAIRTYLRFLQRHGEAVDPNAPFATHVAEHVTEGDFIGNGSPYILFAPDWQPLSDEQMDLVLGRIRATGSELANWAAIQSEAALDAQPATGGRPAREILRHVLAVRGAALTMALGGAPGMARIARAYERGEMGVQPAFDASTERLMAIVSAATPEQRTSARQLPSGPKTLHQSLRRVLEHDWEHLAELARRPGSPAR